MQKMEDNYPYLFEIDENLQFDPIIENFDENLCEYVLSGAWCLDDAFDSGIGLPVDAVAVSEQNSGEGDSSGKITMKPRRERSNTLVLERDRRGRMKEKLYELRSLVPNITKMDKASIIADAIVYVESLQTQAKTLVEEISFLESSLIEERHVVQNTHARPVQDYNCSQCAGKVMGVLVHEVGEGTFHVKVECNKGGVITSSLYTAIESLQHFKMESSNLSFTSDLFVFVATLKITRLGEQMNASDMKLWVMGALLRKGFLFGNSIIQ